MCVGIFAPFTQLYSIYTVNVNNEKRDGVDKKFDILLQRMEVVDFIPFRDRNKKVCHGFCCYK